MTEIVLPQHANTVGGMFGGQLMAWMDVCAAIAAQRYCGRIAVTAAVDDMIFRRPVRVGDIVRLDSRVNAAYRTSVEVEVVVQVEDPATMLRQVCVSAFFTFVAVDEDGIPTAVPPLRCESTEDERRQREAADRRALRLQRRIA